MSSTSRLRTTFMADCVRLQPAANMTVQAFTAVCNGAHEQYVMHRVSRVKTKNKDAICLLGKCLQQWLHSIGPSYQHTESASSLSGLKKRRIQSFKPASDL